METPQVICSNPSLEFLLLENVLCREQLYLLGTGTTHSQTLPTTASESLSSEKGLPALPLHLECPQPPSEPAVGKSINNSFFKCKCLLLSGTVLRTWHVLTHSILTKQTNKQTNKSKRKKPPLISILQRSKQWHRKANFLELLRSARFEPRQAASKAWTI